MTHVGTISECTKIKEQIRGHNGLCAQSTFGMHV